MALTTGDPGSTSTPTATRDLSALEPVVAAIWTKIAALVRGEIQATVENILETANGLTNVAVTMGSPGVPLVASATPWAHVVIPFFAIIQRVQYYSVPSGGSFSVDVKIARPGQSTADAGSFYPGPPPSFTETISISPDSSSWMGYVEPGACLLFYVTAASGVELVTANVILRTIG